MKPRPSYNDKSVLNALVQKLLPTVLAWAGKPEMAEDTAKDLYEAINDSIDLDGYELAANLEDKSYWAVNAELVEILDNAATIKHHEYDKIVAEWVQSEKVKLQREIGDMVEVPSERATGWVQGGIIGLDHIHARYTIRCPTLGHVGPGEIGTLGVVMDAELVRLLEKEAVCGT